MIRHVLESSTNKDLDLPASTNQPLNFWSVWRQHQAYLLNRCRYWMGGNLTDAEDALSQAMIKAWESWPKVFSSLKNPRAWLIRLTHNLCVDLHRKSGRQAVATDQIERYETVTSSMGANSPEQKILQNELTQILQSEIQNLPTSLRETFSDYYLHGKTTQQISKQLAISNNNVYKRLQTAREKLRQRLKQYLYSGRYQAKSCNCLPQETTPVTHIPQSINQNFRITSLCLELQPQLWSLSNSQLGWS